MAKLAHKQTKRVGGTVTSHKRTSRVRSSKKEGISRKVSTLLINLKLRYRAWVKRLLKY